MTSAVVDQVDANVTAVVLSLMGGRRLSVNGLAATSGLSAATLRRRLAKTPGPGHQWLAAEVHTLAEFFGVPVTVLYDGPRALWGNGYRPTTDRYAASNSPLGPLIAA